MENPQISSAFKNNNALIAFITGGDPNIATTREIILEMAKNGVDLIEIGIPFSDPVAEGPVIEAADERALKSGTTVDHLFEMVASLQGEIDIPLVFMTYANPIFKYGAQKFMKKCKEVGINGIIVPDIPFEERNELKPYCTEFNIDQIHLVAPTSKDRIKMIANDTDGFLYIVSSLGVTGMRDEVSTQISEMVKSAKQATDIPCAVGFGISTKEHAKQILKISDGIIIGSAIVNLIAKHGTDSPKVIGKFIKEIKDYCKN